MRINAGLFRGKSTATGEWLYGSLLKVTIKGCPIWIIFEDAFDITGDIVKAMSHACVDPDTVGECTGIPDKTGKLIFEGDILEHHAQGDIVVNRGVVNWDVKNARWAHQLNTMNPCFYMHNPNAVEIIGIVHDNPELLKGGEG